MVRRTVSHKVAFGANDLIRITIEFQMTGIGPHPANARDVWLAARNVAYKHALRVRGKRRPTQQNAQTNKTGAEYKTCLSIVINHMRYQKISSVSYAAIQSISQNAKPVSRRDQRANNSLW